MGETIVTAAARPSKLIKSALCANYNLKSLALYKNNFESPDMQKSLFSEIIPCLKALRHLTVPSNNFRNVATEITQCLVSAESGFPQQLETLNIGNNLFTPNELLALCKVALASGKLPQLKKLVIAFSDLGR